VAIGSVEPLKKLHARWGDRVHFVTVLVRQAHPGPEEPPYRSFGDKLRDAVAFRQSEGIPWSVLADDVQGTVHQVYGAFADPAYLIDRDGRVAFVNVVTSAPVLHEAIAALLARGGRGVVRGGLDRRLHLGPALTDGWRALRRGLPQSFTDLMLAAPGVPIVFWLGHQMRPLLAPLTLRAEPLPAPVKAGLVLGAVGAAALGAWWLASRPVSPD
jgi:hypothetical protein